MDYRFEVLNEIDKGAFGQVLRCYDHKDLEEVAIKINRNSPFDHNNSRVEISILKKIRDGIADDDTSSLKFYKDKIVKIKEIFYFRNHYCMVFEMLGRNLYFDMKEQQFQGYQTQNKLKSTIF